MLATLACASNGNPREDSPGDPTPLGVVDTSSVEIVLARTPCFGTCPAYRLVIRGDGTVNFRGNLHVDSLDPAGVTLSRSDVAQLLRAFEAFDYRSLKGYDSEKCYIVSDNPSAYTSIAYDGKKHEVDHYYGCNRAPEALSDLESVIDSIAGVSRWVGQGTSSRTAAGGAIKDRMADIVLVESGNVASTPGFAEPLAALDDQRR